MTHAGDNRVFALNQANGAWEMSGTIYGLGIGTGGIAITHDGRVAGFRNQVVSIVDVATETERPQTIAVSGSPAGIGMPPP